MSAQPPGPGPGSARRPTVAGLVVGAYLRMLRSGRGLSVVGVGQRALPRPISARTVRRIEQGDPASLHVGRLRALGAFYRIPPDRLQAAVQLLEMDCGALESVRDAGAGYLERLAACEQAADSLRTHAVFTLPACVQTPPYREAVIASWRAVDRAQARRAHPLRALPVVPRGPRTVLVAEHLLHRPTGGARVMALQLARLQTLAELCPGAVRVVPVAAAAEPAPAELVLGGGEHSLWVHEECGAVHYNRYPPGLPAPGSASLNHAHAAAFTPARSLTLIAGACRSFTRV